MFQSFETTNTPEAGAARLTALRAVIQAKGLDGFLVPRADLHQGEYVAPRDERLAWLTGFSGSAGFCAAMLDRAGVFIDGRYRVAVRSQVDLAVFSPVPWPETQLGDWLKQALPEGGRVGFDPWLHTKGEIGKLETALDESGVVLVETDNLVDRIWTDQPGPPLGKIDPYPGELAGRSEGDKRRWLAGVLRDAGERACVLTLPDSIAWLLNIRGRDLERIPVVLACAIVFDNGQVTVFTDPAKASDLPPIDGISFAPMNGFATDLTALEDPVRVDPATAPLAVTRILERAGIEISAADDPCILEKACKTPAELDGARAAHARDAVAMVNFLAWLDLEASKAGLSEIDVVTALEGFRRETNALRDISFETISGAGPNGAIVHYRVTHATNRAINPGELLLVDSGGQYLDGTTDITRTIAVGPPPNDAVEAFTRVLQGMIAISRARWPVGLTGRDLDALARVHLWMAGQDYDHGTGHGVGAYLSVHEGPQRISRTAEVPLRPGMILSNEPGYYREGAFGIRIENLVVVQEAGEIEGGDARDMLSFETLTHVPIDRRLILADRLSTGERDWIDAYHAEVLAKVGPRVEGAAKNWLKRATAPL